MFRINRNMKKAIDTDDLDTVVILDENPPNRVSGRRRRTMSKDEWLARDYFEENIPPRTNKNSRVRNVIVDPPVINPSVPKASKDVFANDPLWEHLGFTGTLPETSIYSQNLDFAGFPVLLEKTYAKLEAINPLLRREVPYCAFQHVYTGMLNATIINHCKDKNYDDRFANEESPANLVPQDMTVPAPIAEYLQMVTNGTTPQGDSVHINLPNGGVPHGPIPAGENLPRIPSGSFGRITECSHNAYECYVSPYVTSRLLEETTKQNTTQVFEPWNPLPDGAFPANCLPNRNLLGYRDVERLTPEVLESLADVDFPDDDTMAGRLRWSPTLVARVSAHLDKLGDRYMMEHGRPPYETSAAVFGWMCVQIAGADTAAHNTQRLATINGTIRSSVALGSGQCGILGVFCMKRERTDTAKGLCYTTAAGVAPAGWDAHINRNYTMLEPFDPIIGTDLPTLRSAGHSHTTKMGDRSLLVATWLNRFEIKQV